mgnify:FL=1
MEINYFISAKATETVQSVNVSLSAEYQKDQAPEVISVVANGYLPNGENQKYMNAALKYNTKSSDFDSINGANVDLGIIQEIVPLITEFYGKIVETVTSL